MTDRSVSVVIPVHDRARAVQAALDSVMAQTCPPLEAIVVDDGSTDGTADAVRARRGDPVPVRVEVLDRNRGGGHARNVGIAAARGAWVALLDSDDRWMPDKLERQLARTAAADTPTVCFSNLLVDRHDGQPPLPWNRKPFADGGDAADYVLEQGQAIQTSTLLLPTALARAVPFDDRLRRHQDLDLVLRLHRAGHRFVCVDAPLVLYSADPAAARTSQRRDAAPSLAWLIIARGHADPAQLARFYAREVFDMHVADAPLPAMVRLARHVLRREIAPAAAARLLAREATPVAFRRWMRRR